MRKLIFVLVFAMVIWGQPTDDTNLPPDIVQDEAIPTDFEITDDFEDVEIDGGCDVILVQGEKCGYLSENEELEIFVKDNELKIKSKKKTSKKKNNYKVYVYFKNLNELEINGAADIINKGNLELDNLEIEVDGATDLILSGKAEDLSIEINGAGEMLLEDFETKNCDIQINGAGDCLVNVSESLNARINGAGNILYTGDPKSIDKKVNGIGKISGMESTN